MKCWILALVLISSFMLVASACGGLSEAQKHYNAGVELQEEDRLQAAIAEYDEAIRLAPEDGDAYYNRGNLYFDLGEYLWAIEDYDEAVRLDPDNADAYYNRALVYTLLGEHTEAQQDVERAVEQGIDRAALEADIVDIKEER